MDVKLNKTFRHQQFILLTENKVNFSVHWLGFLICCLLMLTSSNTGTQFLSFAILLILGSLISFRKAYITQFIGFFFLSIIFSRLLTLDFIVQNGTTYIGGGDDKLFNDLALYFSKNAVDLNDPLYFTMPYKLYMHLQEYWLKIMYFFVGFQDSYRFQNELLMLNSFMGAFVTVNINWILRKLKILTDENKAKYWLVLFNPFLLYYSSVLLREVFLVLFLIMALRVLISDNAWLVKIIFSILLFLAAFFIRPTTSVIIPLMLLVHYFLFLKNNSQRVLLIIFLFSITVFFILPNINELLGKDLSKAQTLYKEMGTEQASESSVGALLLQSSNPIVMSMLPIYGLISPIPPPIFTIYSVKSLILSVGSVAWLITLMALVPNLFSYLSKSNVQSQKEPLFKYIVIVMSVLFFNAVLVGFGSIDARHHLVLYPIITPLSIYFYKKSNLIEFKNYYSSVVLLSILLILVYISLKLFR